MKKLATFVFAMLLTAGLTFAQTGAGSTDQKKPTETTETGKKGKKGGKKGHKGGKKSKKGEKGGETTPPPK